MLPEFAESASVEELINYFKDKDFKSVENFIKLVSVQKLLNLSQSHEFMLNITQLFKENYINFLCAKNIKIYGGINNYINNYYDRNTVDRLIVMELQQTNSQITEFSPLFICKSLLEKMYTMDDVSIKNKNRIKLSIESIQPVLAGTRW